MDEISSNWLDVTCVLPFISVLYAVYVIMIRVYFGDDGFKTELTSLNLENLRAMIAQSEINHVLMRPLHFADGGSAT